ncbi:MAG: L-rhamnose/proton symporter RhaT [Planctomycetota bacterium]|jgi:L-rhamnose-H+ transport protein
METSTLLGFGFILLGAMCGGSFGLPSKFVAKETPWEVLWGPFFLFVTVLIPVLLCPFIADGLYETCAEAGWGIIILPIGFGFLWGLGSMTLGLSFAFIGLSLAYAINYGAQIIFGAMGPLLIHTPGELLESYGFVIMAGVAVCLMGVVVSGKAAILKSSSMEAKEPGAERAGGAMLKGLAIAFLSGLLCACYAIAFSFGGKVMEISETSYGNAPWRTTFVVTALVLWGGAFSSLAYCCFKLTKNQTWGQLTRGSILKILVIALIMALLHDGAILFWGLGASRLGPLGVGVGYAVFMSIAIIVGNVNGFLTGEWRGASRQSVRWIAAGIAILIIGVSVLAKGNIMRTHAAPADDSQEQQATE